jgi:hypothetical protein
VADLGDTLRFKSDVYDSNNALTTPQTIALTVTLPDGTTATPTPVVSSTGKYYADYVTTTQAGRYVGQWLFTFSGGKTTSYVETFDVGASLITVDEAVAHLRANGIITSADDLEQLQWLCLVATDAVERDLARVIARRTITETHDGGSWSVILRQSPVISVTGVTQFGVAIADFHVDEFGILYRGSTNYSTFPFLWGRQNVTVTYVAGYVDPPRIVRKVALNAVQGMWSESQQAAHPALTDFAEGAVFSAQGALTSIEQRAYDSLRAVAIA